MSAVLTMGGVTIGEAKKKYSEALGEWYLRTIFRDGVAIGDLAQFPKCTEAWNATLNAGNDYCTKGYGNTPIEAIQEALSSGVEKLAAAANEASLMKNRDNSDILEAVQGIE